MSLEAGYVIVDDNGNALYFHDDGTSDLLQSTSSAGLFNILISDDGSDPTLPPDKSPASPSSYIKPASASINSDGTFNIIPSNAPTSASSAPMITIAPTIQGNQAKAKLATTMGRWLVTYLKTNAVITTIIADDSTGDGLQTTTTAGNPTTHPASPITLIGSLT